MFCPTLAYCNQTSKIKWHFNFAPYSMVKKEPVNVG